MGCPPGRDSSVFPTLARYWTWACLAIISSLPVRTQFMPAERGCNNEEAAGDHLMAGQESCASAYIQMKLPGEKPNGGWGLITKMPVNGGTTRKHTPGVGVEFGGKVTKTWDEKENVIIERGKERDEVGSKTEPTLNNPLRRSDLILLRSPGFQWVRLMPSVKIKVLTYRPFIPVAFKATLQSQAKGELLSTQHKSTC